jgi:hypothetical protein
MMCVVLLRGWYVCAVGLTALSGCHPEQNPALAGQNIYKSREVQDIQIARLIGKVGGWQQCPTLGQSLLVSCATLVGVCRGM